MLSRHDAAVRSPLLAARGRLRWCLYGVLEYAAVFVAARKEQQGVTGRSTETLVERRYPCRQELGPGMADYGDL